MNNYIPAIDAAARLLNCLPGEVPARIEALLERERMRQVSEPPNTHREVLILNGDRLEIAIYDHGAWIGRLRLDTPPVYCDVRGRWELPLGAEVVE